MSNEFLNGLQAASNAVAGNVAGPVDILAFLLRKAGMPVPENAIGGSNWMTQKGLMAPVRQGASQVIGETAGLLGPAMVSQFGPQIARGLLKGGENLAAPRTLNPQRGAIDLGPKSAVKEGDELIGLHNLTPEKLRHADRIGGLPVPSLAISKTGSPVDGYGDISLVAPKSLVTPGRGNPVFGADAYTPRYPNVMLKPDAFSLKRLNKELEPFSEGGRKIYGSDIERIDDIVSLPQFKAMAKSRGVDVNDYHAMKQAAQELVETADVPEKIFKGYNYNGNRLYKPHTLENVVKEMRSQGVRNGENFTYGTSSVKAAVTPQFKSMKSVQAARGTIADKSTVEAAKVANSEKFIGLIDELVKLSPSKDFGAYDNATSNVIDWSKGRVKLEDFYPGITPDLKQRLSAFLGELRKSPVGYLEAKPQRAVNLNEFVGAIVPSTVDDKTLGLLSKHGITNIQKYGSPEEKAKAARAFTDHLFNFGVPAGVGLGAYGLLSQEQTD